MKSLKNLESWRECYKTFMGKYIKVIRKFTGKIDWKLIKSLLLLLVGKEYAIKETKEIIKVDKKFVKEYVSSKYTKGLNSTFKKIKANLSNLIEELIENASHPKTENNKEDKHKSDAYKGWKKFTSRFIIETYDSNSNKMVMQKYTCVIVARCPNYKEMYLYDIVNIKKEADKSQ